MHLHEYQTSALLNKYGIHTPVSKLILKKEELYKAWKELNLTQGVLKAQVHSGGRGKAGGIFFVKSVEEAEERFNALIGTRFISPQTGSEGLPIEKILLTAAVSIKKEYYCALTYNSEKKERILLISSEGGVEIELLAERSPEKILTMTLSTEELKPFHLLNIFHELGWEGPLRKKGEAFFKGLFAAFKELDSTLLEINPLVLTKELELIALDAKMTIDESALYRHPDLNELFDPSQLSSREILAKKYDLAYVSLQGTIGCMVNGAGLAMATMDILHTYGGKPANFLDVGGGASDEKIMQGFEIILQDVEVKALFVNIFGGIMDCAKIAQGLLTVFSKKQKMPPTVVRMEGTNADKAHEILRSLPSIHAVPDFAKAAELVVKLAHS